MTKHAIIEEWAAHWLIEQEDPEFSQEQQAAFQSWLNENPQHQKIFDDLAHAWGRVDLLRNRLKPLREELARQIMRSRDLDAPEAYRLTRESLDLLRGAVVLQCEPALVPACEEPPPIDLVTSNVARDWFCSLSMSSWAETLEPLYGSVEHYPRCTRSSLPISIEEDFPTSPPILVWKFKRILSDAMRSLPHYTQCVFALRQGYGLSDAQIAGKLDLSADAVAYHLESAAYRCVKHMLDHFSPEQQASLFASLVCSQENARRRGWG